MDHNRGFVFYIGTGPTQIYSIHKTIRAYYPEQNGILKNNKRPMGLGRSTEFLFH